MKARHIVPLTAALALVGLLAAACGEGSDATAGSATESSGASTEARAAEEDSTRSSAPSEGNNGNTRTAAGAGLYTLDEFVSALGDYGLRVEALDAVRQPFLSIMGAHLRLTGVNYLKHGLGVYVYPDEATRIEDSSWLGDDLYQSLPLIEWIATPHLYARGNLLVFLVSDDGGLVAAVAEAVATLP